MAVDSLPYILPNFDHLGAGEDPSKIVGGGCFDSENGNMQIVTAGGLRYLRCFENSGNPSARITLPSVTEIVIGFRAVFNSGGISTPTLAFYSGGTLEMNLQSTAAGVLQLDRGTTLIASDSTVDHQDVTARYYEFAYKVAQSGGVYEVRLEGVPIMSGTADTTVTGNPIDQFRIFGGNTFASGEYVQIRDVYFKAWASAGDPGFYGPIALHLQNPIATVAADFTPTPGSGEDNHEDVDETPTDDDTTYVETSDVGDVDEYELSTLPGGVQSVLAVIRGTVGKAPSGGVPTTEHGLKRGGDEAYGSARSLGASYGTSATPHFTQPDGSPWTVDAANDLNSLDRSA